MKDVKLSESEFTEFDIFLSSKCGLSPKKVDDFLNKAERSFNPNIVTEQHCENALHLAVRKGSFRIIKILLHKAP